jgi:amino acid adenylation domain-containing protein
VVLKEGIIDFRVEDIQYKDQNEQQAYIIALREADKDEGFDLSAGPLVRLIIVKISENRFYRIWSNHHLNLDGWSTNALLYEFDVLYKSIIGKQPSTIPDLEPYSQFIDWLDSIDFKKSRSYWNHYLADYESRTTLPFNKENLTEQTGYILKDYEFWLSEELSNNLNAIAIKEKITLNTILQSAWGILLSRYNNTQDVVFGSVVSGRPSELKGIQEMIGIFINTIPQRIRYTDQTTFSELLQLTQKSFIEGEPHHHLNLAEIQHQSDLGMNLIEHLVVFENYPRFERQQSNKNFNAKNIKLQSELIVEANSAFWFEQMHYDFTLIIIPSDKLFFRIKYNENKYSEGFIKRLEGQWKQLLGEITKNTKSTVTAYEILTQEEKIYLLDTLNDTKAEYPKDKTIVDLFEDQVKLNPENIAVRFNNNLLTYRELNEKSNQLAHYLIKNYNIQPDELVGIELERSEWMVIGILAIIKSGGAYVPIDPEFPNQRKSYIKLDAKLKVIINEIELTNFIKNSTVNEFQKCNPKINISPSSLIYVIYTSGTTGNPKGVMIEHTSIVNRVLHIINYSEINSSDLHVFKTNIVFDASVFELFCHLVVGASIEITKNIFQIDELEMILSIQKPSSIHLVPSQFEIMKDIISKSKLRKIYFSGEALTESILSGVPKKIKVFNYYGPTELGEITGYSPMNPREPLIVGKVFPNSTNYILDKNMTLVPFGVEGELYVGGVGIARGYLNQDELTRERFIDNPFKKNNESSSRIYKTGDLVRFLDHGNIEFLGRNDYQVKIRGNRIELGEIESILKSYPKIVNSVVIAKSVFDCDKELIAYYIGDVNLTELKTFLKERIPLYAIPSYFIKMENIPLTSNGKLNTKALPKPENKLIDSKINIIPTNEIEKKLVEIWSEILGLDKNYISIEDDFFELGGHSLKAIRLISKINKSFNLNYGLKNVFLESTIKKIAIKIELDNWQREKGNNNDYLDFVI